MSAWEAKLKGITVYREGSSEGIMVSDTLKEHAEAQGHPTALADEYVDTIAYCVQAEGGDKFYIHVSYLGKDTKRPYQIFINNYKTVETDSFVKIGNALIRHLNTIDFEPEKIQQQLDRSHNSLIKLTRFVSLFLKNHMLQECLDVLNDFAFVGSLAARLYDILSASAGIKPKCPSCESTNVHMVEGCMLCRDCGGSLCS